MGDVIFLNNSKFLLLPLVIGGSVCFCLPNKAQNRMHFLVGKQLEYDYLEMEYSLPKIITNDGKPTKVLQQLLDIMGIQHDGTLQNLVEITQKEWLRQAGKERWEINDRFSGKREQVMSCIGQLGVVDEVKPTQRHYSYALLFGALLERTRSRLAHLIRLYNEGVRFNELVILTGQRYLNDKRESQEILLDGDNGILPIRKDWKFDGVMPKTEAEMIRIVLDQADLPQGMEKIKVTFVDSPMQQNADGSFRRPTTPDTVEDWLKKNPTPGTCLAISNQPYVGYQHETLCSLLPPPFIVQTIGLPVSRESGSIAVYLDSIARWLYEKNKRKKKFAKLKA